MDFTDLLLVFAYAGCMYALIIALARKPHFLTRGVNPHRGSVLLAAISVLAAGAGLLRWEAGSGNIGDWGRLLGKLVTHEPTPPRVQAAAVAFLFGGFLLMLVLWCWWFLPRDPSTFQGPNCRQRALHYYVKTLKGGLDFALLAEGEGAPIVEAADPRWIARASAFLPNLRGSDGKMRERTAQQQIQNWRSTAIQIHKRMTELDAAIEPAQQGRNRRIVFDAEYGALFFYYLRPPHTAEGVAGLYLFGATLSQQQVNNKRTDQHFDLLVEALRNVERAIKLA